MAGSARLNSSGRSFSFDFAAPRISRRLSSSRHSALRRHSSQRTTPFSFGDLTGAARHASRLSSAAPRRATQRNVTEFKS
jgi:hypothetical protein